MKNPFAKQKKRNPSQIIIAGVIPMQDDEGMILLWRRTDALTPKVKTAKNAVNTKTPKTEK